MTKTPTKHDGPHHVDVHVGRRVYERRAQLGITQGDLARALGVSFQQLQKYEKGANRISASRLWGTAAALAVDIDYFFEGLDDGGGIDIAECNPGALQTKVSQSVGAHARALPVKGQRLILELIKILIDRE